MSTLLDTHTKVVVQISNERSTAFPSSGPSHGVTIYAEQDGRLARLLDEIIADPNTRKVVSYSRNQTARQSTGVQDFCSAMRLVEQECYQSA